MSNEQDQYNLEPDPNDPNICICPMEPPENIEIQVNPDDNLCVCPPEEQENCNDASADKK